MMAIGHVQVPRMQHLCTVKLCIYRDYTASADGLRSFGLDNGVFGVRLCWTWFFS